MLYGRDQVLNFVFQLIQPSWQVAYKAGAGFVGAKGEISRTIAHAWVEKEKEASCSLHVIPSRVLLKLTGAWYAGYDKIEMAYPIPFLPYQFNGGTL